MSYLEIIMKLTRKAHVSFASTDTKAELRPELRKATICAPNGCPKLTR